MACDYCDTICDNCEKYYPTAEELLARVENLENRLKDIRAGCDEVDEFLADRKKRVLDPNDEVVNDKG